MSNKWETAPESIKDLYSFLYSFMKGIFYTFDVDVNFKYELLDKVLDDYNKLEAKHQKALEAISRCTDEIDDKDILISEQDKLIDELTHENHVFRLKNALNRTYGLTGQIELLNEEINDLKKENKDLKDTLEKDKEFEKNIGERVANSIREGCNKGAYKLNPDTRIDIHVEQANDALMIFDRHAIPRIAITFNNTQTEMERDTAEHECEELNEKVDSLWRVNEELNKKIKTLEKENKGLRRTIAWFNDDV